MSPRLIPWFFILAAASVQADEPVGYQTGLRLMQKYHCQQCHAIDHRLSGPSLRAIAKRYASDPHERHPGRRLGTSADAAGAGVQG